MAISGTSSCCSSALRITQMQYNEKSEADSFLLWLAAVSVAVQAFKLIHVAWCLLSLLLVAATTCQHANISLIDPPTQVPGLAHLDAKFWQIFPRLHSV